jgi:hypothetical protein
VKITVHTASLSALGVGESVIARKAMECQRLSVDLPPGSVISGLGGNSNARKAIPALFFDTIYPCTNLIIPTLNSCQFSCGNSTR